MVVGEALKKIIGYIVHVADPEKIILFGSMATGNCTVYSDIDLLIVVEQAGNHKQLEQQIRYFTKQCAFNSDVIVRTVKDVLLSKTQPYGFLHLILKQGKTVYVKNDT